MLTLFARSIYIVVYSILYSFKVNRSVDLHFGVGHKTTVSRAPVNSSLTRFRTFFFLYFHVFFFSILRAVCSQEITIYNNAYRRRWNWWQSPRVHRYIRTRYAVYTYLRCTYDILFWHIYIVTVSNMYSGLYSKCIVHWVRMQWSGERQYIYIVSYN